jgi:hypothetical protein
MTVRGERSEALGLIRQRAKGQCCLTHTVQRIQPHEQQDILTSSGRGYGRTHAPLVPLVPLIAPLGLIFSALIDKLSNADNAIGRVLVVRDSPSN